MGIRDRPISPRSPWQNPYVERLIGTLRRLGQESDQVLKAATEKLVQVPLVFLCHFKLTHISEPTIGSLARRRQNAAFCQRCSMP